MNLDLAGLEASDDFGDFEQFLSYWQDDSAGFSHFVGRAIGRIGYRNLPDLFFAIGASYFALQDIAGRIDFLYEHHDSKIGGEKGRLISQMVDVFLQDDVVCLRDKTEDHRDVRCGSRLARAMLLRDVVGGCPYFSVRLFIEYGDRFESKRPNVKTTFYEVAARNTREEGRYGISHEFWNFRVPENPLEGVTVYPEAQGFFDVKETKGIADLIVLASNGAGFTC